MASAASTRTHGRAWSQTARPPTAEGASSGSDEDGVTASGTAHLEDSVLEHYLAEFDGDEQSGLEELLRAVREHLATAGGGSAVCLICLEHIKRADAVWACWGSCSAVLHLLCIQAWARQQLDAAALKAKNEADGRPTEAPVAAPLPTWGCPKCRRDYTPSQAPTEYRCFCGKQCDPPVDAWLPAHTCGDMCRRSLPCGHTCVLLCHPGPCPPCPRLVEAACHCGKEATQRRCSQAAFSCNKLCGAAHACGHRCPLRCHPGPCPSCGLASKRTCHCGAETQMVPCKEPVFQCGRVCGKPLACGRHRCEAVCHAGGCCGCPMEGERRCPCGKATYSDLSCDEPTPTCGQTCDKLLSCRQHRCAERCHLGPCSQVCRAPAVKVCACGKAQKQVQCHETLRCERRCMRMRNCRRHQCKRRCCDGDCPSCQEECGRVLRCGNHRCPATCHSGACLPCPLELSVACACGRTSYRLPCAWQAKATPPRCDQPCPVPRLCRHADQHKRHRCHFGPCPGCNQPCATQLPCGHTCASPACHDPAPPAIPPFQQPPPPSSPGFQPVKKLPSADYRDDTPPVVQVARAAAAGESSGGHRACPPCRAPVMVPCLGHSLLQLRECCDSAPQSCEAPCGRRLPCGNHTCTLLCHSVTPYSPGAEVELAGRECEACTRSCEEALPCGHACPLPCHPGACPPCALPAERGCHCGKTTIALDCHALTSEEPEVVAATSKQLCCGKPCSQALPSCPHVCLQTCHPRPCPGAQDCPEEVVVRCACRRRKDRMRCSEVREALAAEGDGNGSYTSATTLRLLPCDAQCEAQRVHQQTKQQAEHKQAATAMEAKAGASGSSAVASEAAAGGSARVRRLNKEERLRERAEAQAQAERDDKRRRRLETAKKWAGSTAWAAVFAGLVWLLFSLLKAQDTKYRASLGAGEL